MLHILLCILKIIGITLLVLLAVLLAATLLLLFVPVRYRASAEKDGADGSYELRAGASWLLHILSLRYGMGSGEEASYQVRLLGIVIYDSRKREEYAARRSAKEARRAEKEKRRAGKGTGRVNKKKPGGKSKSKKRNAEALPESIQSPRETRELKSGETAGKQETGIGQETAGKQEAIIKEKPAGKEKVRGVSRISGTGQEDKRSALRILLERLKEFFGMLLGKLQNIRYTILRFCDRIKQIRDNIAYYIELFEKEETRAALCCCRKQLGALWKNIRPKRLKLTLRAGFEDPADTGQLLAAYSMVYPWVYDNIRVEPDFEKAVLEGTFYCRGRVTVFILLKAAWILYFNKDIRTFLRLWKKEEA